jgi:hypothetical protein
MRWHAFFHMMDCLLWLHPMIFHRTKFQTRIRRKEADPPREMEWVISHLMVSSCLCLQMSRTMQLSVLLAVEDKAVSKDSVITSDHGCLLSLYRFTFLIKGQGRLGLERNKIHGRKFCKKRGGESGDSTIRMYSSSDHKSTVLHYLLENYSVEWREH